MTTSSTYAFAPSLGELVLYSFGLIGLRPTSLLQEHYFSARVATNLMLASWANQGVNLWTVDLVTVPLVQGQATYDVAASTIMMLDAYMVTDNGAGPATDRIILPVSRTEYASYPNKEQQGFTTVFWFDRLIAPTVTLWPVPDGTSAQYLKYYRCRQIQDANLANAENVEIPYRWLDAFAEGLAFRLAKSWAPDKAGGFKTEALEAYNIAAFQDEENAATFISPQVSGYFRT